MVVPFVYTEEEYKKLEEENRKLKSREEKLMAYYKWYVDKEHNLTEVEDIITENIKLKERIEELETDYDRLKVAFEDVVSWK